MISDQALSMGISSAMVCAHRYAREIPTLYTAPCNAVISHGAQIRGLWVFPNHTCKNK